MGAMTKRDKLYLAIGILGYMLLIIFAFISPFMPEYIGWAILSGIVGAVGTGLFFDA